MKNRYEASEVIELGKARDEILSEKRIGGPVDNFGVPFFEWARTLDDFDE